MNLEDLGWSAEWQGRLPENIPAAAVPARVVAEDRHAFTVVTLQGPRIALLPGRILQSRNDPLSQPKVGDWVVCEPVPGESKVLIRHILPRRSILLRKLAGRDASSQVLAANVDVTLITQGLDQPLNPRRIERFLVMALQGGSRPVLLLNKADLHPRPDEALAHARLAAPGIEVLPLSARTGTGLPILLNLLAPRQTCVFLGTSGVGKSTLINRLLGDDVQATCDVRSRDAKGRHTTTTRELIPLPNGALVIDTPGMREFHLWEAGDGVADAFPDILVLAAGCRFRDCRHHGEAGCAVRLAAEQGALPATRLEAWLKLQRELHTLRSRRTETSRRPSRRPAPHPHPGDPFDED